MRDDINPLMAEKFNLEYIDSMAYNSLKLTSSEDPCYSPFVSQDQVWNLMLPMFFTDFGLQNRLKSILDYIIVNKHKIYNPYLSEILHYYTFLPSMNEKKVKPWDRIYNRMEHFKPNIKVKGELIIGISLMGLGQYTINLVEPKLKHSGINFGTFHSFG